MRVLIFDRSITNHYTVGLAIGLQRAGADVRVAGPANSSESFVVPVYPRAVVSGQKAAKTVEALRGAANWWSFVAGDPTFCTFNGVACPTTRWRAPRRG